MLSWQLIPVTGRYLVVKIIKVSSYKVCVALYPLISGLHSGLRNADKCWIRFVLNSHGSVPVMELHAEQHMTTVIPDTSQSILQLYSFSIILNCTNKPCLIQSTRQNMYMHKKRESIGNISRPAKVFFAPSDQSIVASTSTWSGSMH